MKEPLYRQALTHSWHLVWQHKILWIFGLFATFLGQMGILDLFSKVTMASSDYALYPKWLALPKLIKYLASGFGFFSLPFEGWIWLVWLILILVSLCILFVFIAVVSQGAIVYISSKFIKGKKISNVGAAWHVGVVHFWKLFFLNFVKKIIMVLLAVAVGYGTLNFIVLASGRSIILFLIIFLLAILLGMILSFLVIYSAAYVVVEEYSLRNAIESAWKMFLNHWLVSIEVGLIVLFLNILVGFVTVLAFIVIFFPTIIVWLLASVISSYSLYVVGIIIGVILFTLFIILIGSIFTVYTTSVWIYLFMKMHKEGVTSRILHWAGHHK